jgi:hypothetical protein
MAAPISQDVFRIAIIWDVIVFMCHNYMDIETHKCFERVLLYKVLPLNSHCQTVVVFQSFKEKFLEASQEAKSHITLY